MTVGRYASRLQTSAAAATCAAAAFGGCTLGFGADDGRALALAYFWRGSPVAVAPDAALPP